MHFVINTIELYNNTLKSVLLIPIIINSSKYARKAFIIGREIK